MDPDYLARRRLCQGFQGHLDKPEVHVLLLCRIAGLHDMLSYVLKHGNRNAEYKIFCDNESVLKVLDPTKEPTIVELSKADGKLVQQTRATLQKFR